MTLNVAWTAWLSSVMEEILAKALEHREQGRPRSRANARLLAYAVEPIFRWRRFHQTRSRIREFISSQSSDFADSVEWCDVEARAESLLILWEHGVDIGAAPPWAHSGV
ncbi:predicted protein [Postia placenta Mad-698-R]|nr:predicted protein [Postia placenta Mad-698-R]